MSYLLKALEKAQQEREAQQTHAEPSSQPVQTAAQLPKGVYAVAAVILLAVLYTVFVPNSQINPDISPEATSEMSSEISSEAKLDEVVLVVDSSISELPQEIEVEAAAVKTVQASSSENAQDSVPTSEEKPTSNGGLAPATISAPSPKDLLELDAQTLSVLPTIRFQSHIYSTAASYRSVVVNDRTLSEGMSIAAGLKIEEITQTGLVVSFKGQLIHFPKGQDWIAPAS